MTSALSCKALSCHFGGLVALNSLDLAVTQGEILGVVGPNGSGKSTLLDLLSGIRPPTSGDIWLSDRKVTSLPAWRMARLGLARTFQMLRLFPHLTVLENLTVGESWRLRSSGLESAMGRRAARSEEATLNARAFSLLERFDLGMFRNGYPSELSIGQQRMVEIARCLMTSPKVLLLDEPAAGLSPPNVDRLIEYIRAIRVEHGTTIVFVEHVMRVVTAVCDRVAVLDHGVLLATGLPDDVLKQEAVVEAYLGVGRA